MRRLSVIGAAALAVVLAGSSAVRAETIGIHLDVPSFLIPLGGQSGTLNVFSNGTAPTTEGFDALGTQVFFLPGNSPSSGELILNLHFFGFPLGDPGYTVSNAEVRFRVYDLDFFPDQVTAAITLTEAALILNTDPHIDLSDYLPRGQRVTDDEDIILSNINLSALPQDQFTNPFVLQLLLSAEVVNNGSGAWLQNTPESVLTSVRLELTPTPVSVPEPSLSLGLGLVSLGLVTFGRRREQ